MTTDLSTAQLQNLMLSVDVYNHGDNAGLDDMGTGQGASVPGGVTLLFSSDTLTASERAFNGATISLGGFYAAAYELSDGDIVIAYRGADQWNPLSSPYAYSDDSAVVAAMEGYITDQSILAIQFYNKVKATYPDAAISFTGHSLGGSLAGVVGSLSGEEASIFNAVPYQAVVDRIETALNPTSVGYDAGYANALQTLIYGSNAATAPTNAQIDSVGLTGEIAATFRDPDDITVSLDSTDSLSSLQRHQIPLLSLVAYGDGSLSGANTWRAAEDDVLPALFNDSVAAAAGVASFNTNSASGVLMNELVYSETGGNDEKFGNVAASALFNDARDLGHAISDGTMGLGSGEAAIGQAIAYYAGLEVEAAQVDGDATGFLSYASADGQSTLTADFTSGPWTMSESVKDSTFAANAMMSGLEADVEVSLPDDYLDTWLDATIGQVSFAGGDGFIGTVPASLGPDPDYDYSAFVGTKNSDTIQGAEGNNIIFGGYSPTSSGDTIYGGSGYNMIVGSNGDDTMEGGWNAGGNGDIFGGNGNDTISNANLTYGGAGNDVISNVNFASGGAGNDVIQDASEADGGDGNDTITDTYVVEGGAGRDTFSYTSVQHSSMSVLLVDDPNLTDAELQNLDSSSMPESVFGSSNVPNIDTIIFNADGGDSLKVLGDDIAGTGTYQMIYPDLNMYGFKDDAGTLYSFNSIDDDHAVQSVTVGNYTIYGYADGDLGINFSGNGPVFPWETSNMLDASEATDMRPVVNAADFQWS